MLVVFLVTSDRLVLKLSDGVGDSSEAVKAQNRLSDIAVNALENVLAQFAPIQVSRSSVSPRKEIDRAPRCAVFLDEPCVPLGSIDGRERARRRRIERFEQHESSDRPFDAVRIIGEKTNPLRHVADDVPNPLAPVVVRLRQSLEPPDHAVSRAEPARDLTHQRRRSQLARHQRELPQTLGVVDRVEDHDVGCGPCAGAGPRAAASSARAMARFSSSSRRSRAWSTSYSATTFRSRGPIVTGAADFAPRT